MIRTPMGSDDALQPGRFEGRVTRLAANVFGARLIRNVRLKNHRRIDDEIEEPASWSKVKTNLGSMDQAGLVGVIREFFRRKH